MTADINTSFTPTYTLEADHVDLASFPCRKKGEEVPSPFSMLDQNKVMFLNIYIFFTLFNVRSLCERMKISLFISKAYGTQLVDVTIQN